ncbi:MAG: MFS transporter [Patescibacteria group bacterium]|nr:MFS transporter [Patescibacteria group bacterium]
MNEQGENKVFILFLIIFRVLRSVAAGIIAISFPYLILTKLRYSAFTLGSIYTVAIIATAVLGLMIGYIADAGSRKKSLLLASLILPISALMVYYSNNIFILFIAAAIGGYSATGSLAGGGVGGLAAPAQDALMIDLAPPRRRTFYFSLAIFLAGFGAALGALLIDHMSEQNLFLLAASISFISVLFIIPISDNKNDKKRKYLFGPIKNKAIIGKFTTAGILNGFSQGLITPFLIPFFIIIYHISIQQMSVYAFISGLIGSFALLLAPWLDRHFGFLKSIVFTRGIGTIATVALPIFRVLPISLGIYFLIPALRIAATPIQQSALTEMIDGEEMGRVLGINQSVGLAASSTATVFSGYLFSLDEIGIPFYLYGILMAANLLLYYKFFKNFKH